MSAPLVSAVRRKAWLLGLLLACFGFALILAAGFVFDAASVACAQRAGAERSSACERPQQLATAGATLLFLGGGFFGLGVMGRIGGRSQGAPTPAPK